MRTSITTLLINLFTIHLLTHPSLLLLCAQESEDECWEDEEEDSQANGDGNLASMFAPAALFPGYDADTVDDEEDPDAVSGLEEEECHTSLPYTPLDMPLCFSPFLSPSTHVLTFLSPLHPPHTPLRPSTQASRPFPMPPSFLPSLHTYHYVPPFFLLPLHKSCLSSVLTFYRQTLMPLSLYLSLSCLSSLPHSPPYL